MKKINLSTPDLTKRNIEKLSALLPNVVKEGKVDFELLKQMLGDYLIDGCKERYGLNWVGKRESILKANTPINKTLRPVLEKSVDFENTKNLYIEGDNFEVLKIIQESYLNKIKMIYIDPPYNTGKDFIYKDNFKKSKEDYEEEIEAVDEEGVKLYKNTDSNGRFHSDWLSMMYERLLVARDLLREDGVIFISIDDNEVHNLRHICDEIFGEGNFLGQLIVKSNPGGRDYGGIAQTHEYILSYGKSEKSELFLIESDKEFPFYDKFGGFEIRELRNRNIKFNINNRPNLYYPFYVNPNSIDKNGLYEVSLEYKEGFIEVYPKESQGIKTVWRWGKEKVLKHLNIDVKAKKKQDGDFMIIEKYRSNLKRLRSILDEKDVRNEKGSLDIKELFENKPFDYPKSVYLIKTLLKIGMKEDDIILDFFSGSATTAHAVMELNAEDGGNRQFIMVQLPERVDEKSEAYKAGYRTICDIGRERIIRAAKKIKEDFKDKVYIDNLDFGFRYFKVDTSNFKEARDISEIKQENLFETIENIKPDRNDLDLLFEVILNLGLELTLDIEMRLLAGKKVYFVENNSLVACFDDNIDETFAEILTEGEDKPFKIVLKDNSFKSDSDKINFEQTVKELSPDTEILVV